VVAVPHETPPPPLVPRVTLTLLAINGARQVVFLVSDASKAKRLAEILEISSLPTQMIQLEQGEGLCLIDKSAAGSTPMDMNG
jgi:6-phosphogluconolactonase/glucosamine-6-phosphate isomerase/deaminase